MRFFCRVWTALTRYWLRDEIFRQNGGRIRANVRPNASLGAVACFSRIDKRKVPTETARKKSDEEKVEFGTAGDQTEAAREESGQLPEGRGVRF